MSEGPWIRFFPSDWLAGTRGMTAAETGIYITLIAMMYERGEPIPNDTSRLARLCGTTTAALRSTLAILCEEGKIDISDDGLWNDRVGVETEIRRDKSTSAKKSAEMRWKKNQQKQRRTDANALQPQSERNANQKPEIRIEKEEASASSKKRARRLPSDWTVPDEWIQEAVAEGMSRDRALSEAERMKNWSISSKNGAKLDWHAAWRNWYRDKLETTPRAASPPPQRDSFREALEREAYGNHERTDSTTRHGHQGDAGTDFASPPALNLVALPARR